MKKQRKGTARDIGLDVKPPTNVCQDKKCPWHGTLSVRGRIIEGIVVSSKAQKTAIVERTYFHYIPKYERYERRHSRIAAYNPECIAAKEGERVKIAETKPVSKTKAFAIIEIMEKKG
jgi:small subunit ribosomal protein S17